MEDSLNSSSDDRSTSGTLRELSSSLQLHIDTKALYCDLEVCQTFVSRRRLRQLPSLTDEGVLTEQATIRRIRDLPMGEEAQSPARPFHLDECLAGDDSSCF